MVSVKSIAAREKRKVATAKASIKTAKSRAKAAEKNLKTAKKELAKAQKVAGKNIAKAKDAARKVKEKAEAKKAARRAASTPATAEKPAAVKDTKSKCSRHLGVFCHLPAVDPVTSQGNDPKRSDASAISDYVVTSKLNGQIFITCRSKY